MAIVYYTNPKTKARYAYESESYWVPELKQPRSRRRYLGRVAEDGTIIPSDGRRGRKPPAPREEKAPPAGDPTINSILKEKDEEIKALRKENRRLRSMIAAIQGIVRDEEAG